jgi:hypothetical protein
VRARAPLSTVDLDLAVDLYVNLDLVVDLDLDLKMLN